jgi:hypothetical protein
MHLTFDRIFGINALLCRKFLDKIGVHISDHFAQLLELESFFEFLCNGESLVNQLDFQNCEQFTKL